MNRPGVSARTARVWLIDVAFVVVALSIGFGVFAHSRPDQSRELQAVLAQHADAGQRDSIQVGNAVAAAAAALRNERELARRRDV